MLKYFYYLYFQYETEKDIYGNPVNSTFSIGYLSTKAKAMEKINEYKDITGFKNYPVDNFKILRQGVKFNTNIEDKSKINLYELSHEYVGTDGYDYPTIFGVFSTEDAAKEEREKQKKKKPYSLFPDNFVIDKIKVDRQFEWAEGFTPWE